VTIKEKKEEEKEEKEEKEEEEEQEEKEKKGEKGGVSFAIINTTWYIYITVACRVCSHRYREAKFQPPFPLPHEFPSQGIGLCLFG
jgi:hypothetical protein